jgi:hypothetical protein
MAPSPSTWRRAPVPVPAAALRFFLYARSRAHVRKRKGREYVCVCVCVAQPCFQQRPCPDMVPPRAAPQNERKRPGPPLDCSRWHRHCSCLGMPDHTGCAAAAGAQRLPRPHAEPRRPCAGRRQQHEYSRRQRSRSRGPAGAHSAKHSPVRRYCGHGRAAHARPAGSSCVHDGKLVGAPPDACRRRPLRMCVATAGTQSA